MAHSNYSLDHIRDDINEDQQEQQHFSHAMELAFSLVFPRVFKAAVDLQVLDIIANAGLGAQLSPSQIASQLPANTLDRNPNAAKMLDRMLRLLASHSILTCTVVDLPSDSPTLVVDRRLYGLAPVAKYFVSNQDGVSFAPTLCLVQEKAFSDSWYELKGAVLEGGIPFDRFHGTSTFEYLGKDPNFNELFNKTMINQTTLVLNKILQSSYNGFEQLEKLVDVGGGLGIAVNLITSKYPHIKGAWRTHPKGINFDLPHVIQHAPPYPGVEHVEGNMFVSVPQGDAIFLKYILHSWSDDHCVKLLKNCHKALPDNGKIILVEGILPVMPDSSASTKAIFQFDLLMMAQHSGIVRTQQDLLALAIGAGFSGIRLECFICNIWVMELYK